MHPSIGRPQKKTTCIEHMPKPVLGPCVLDVKAGLDNQNLDACTLLACMYVCTVGYGKGCGGDVDHPFCRFDDSNVPALAFSILMHQRGTHPASVVFFLWFRPLHRSYASYVTVEICFASGPNLDGPDKPEQIAISCYPTEDGVSSSHLGRCVCVFLWFYSVGVTLLEFEATRGREMHEVPGMSSRAC